MQSQVDSAISVPDMLIAQLQQECNVWKEKCKSEKQEALRLAGILSKNNRSSNGLEAQKKELADLEIDSRSRDQACHNVEIARLEFELTRKNEIIDKVGAELTESRRLVREAELRQEAIRTVSATVLDKRSTSSELEHARNVKTPVTDNPILSMMRTRAESAGRLIPTRSRGNSTETESFVSRSPRTAHSSQEAVSPDTSSGQAVSTSSCAGRVQRLSISVIQGVVVEPQESHVQGHDLTHQNAWVSRTSTDLTSLSEELELKSISEPRLPETNQVKTEVNLTVHINHTDQKNLTILQRARSALSKTARLDVLGPKDHVDAFLTSLNKVEAAHVDEAAAARHWQDVALRSLEEVDTLRTELNSRPSCAVIAHRSMADELEAKNLQLQMQSALVADWQKKIARARAFFEDANAELQLQKVNRLADMTGNPANMHH